MHKNCSIEFNNIVYTVYKFHGCFWQGCPDCYPQRLEPLQQLYGRCMENVYRETKQRGHHLAALGYHVVEQWECAWHRQKHEDPALAAFVVQLDLQPPLDPREAFFGGRTNAVRLHACTTDPQRPIAYYDYTSLYPWVNKNGAYPIGHHLQPLGPEHPCLL